MKQILFVFLSILFLTSCSEFSDQSSEALITPTSITLVPLTAYHTPTSTRSSSIPHNPATSTPVPSPTPTPRIHIVADGEDMFGIALRYGVTLAELQTTNPDVNPNLMSVGQQLVIPESGQSEDAPEGILPSPTPLGIDLGEVYCYQNKDQSAWCFLQANNHLDSAVEGVSARVRIALENGELLSGTALSILNLIPASSSQALSVYFPPLPAAIKGASAEALSALPAAETKGRYLPLRSFEQDIIILEDGKSVLVQGKLTLENSESSASQVWVGAMVYDVEGKIAGLRRWESNQTLAAGESLQYELRVYSSGGKISSAAVWFEARP